jgi:hypothetical protein
MSDGERKASTENGGPSRPSRTAVAARERRRRLLTRVLPIGVVALVAFVAGVATGAGPDAPGAESFLEAWEESDYAGMYEELAPAAQEAFSSDRFERAYRSAATTATLTSLEVGDVDEDGGIARAPVTVDTHVFGTLVDEIELPLTDKGIEWAPELVHPGLEAGEQLTRQTRAPPRAAILAADGSPLAEGPAIARTVAPNATGVVGEVGTPSEERAVGLDRLGFPPGSPAGLTGLELAFDERIAGRPGGRLLATTAAQRSSLAEGRLLASSQPVRGKRVRTTIDPAVQGAAVSALGDLYGGVAVLNARDGSVMALAGLAYSAPQPPGSTFKVITATAGLEAGVVKTTDTFPVETSNHEIGREISNSHDTPCGGTFVESFAKSCNTVFAPLGVRVGGERLVETAERFGFNSPPALFDDEATEALAPPGSTLPTDLESDVAVGETAIGQGRVLATPLQMASVAQTIAANGRRLPTPIARDPELQPDGGAVRVTSREVATTLRQLMVEVVENGTGTAADLPTVQVAGKTGTAELGPAPLEPGQELAPGEDPPQKEDAWFTAFAPAADPKVAVAVMIVEAEGDGGTVAAPIARQVIASALGVSG